MQCPQCLKTFSAKSSLLRHLRESCRYRVVSESNAAKKIKVNNSHSAKYFEDKLANQPGPSSSSSIEFPISSQETRCPICDENVQKCKLTGHLRSSGHTNRIEITGDGIEKVQHAFKNRIASFRFSVKEYSTDIRKFLEEVKEKVFIVIEKYIKEFSSLKINVELFGIYIIEEKELSDMKSFNTRNRIVTLSTDLEEMYNDFEEEIIEKASTFQERDSGMLNYHSSDMIVLIYIVITFRVGSKAC